MADKKNPGAPLKFPNTKTKTLRISRIVPENQHNEIKDKTNEFITKLQSESLNRCYEEFLKSNV